MSFIKFEVWDGKTIFLWHDNSHPIGTLSLEFGYRVIYDAASKPEAEVVFRGTKFGFGSLPSQFLW